MSRLDSLAKVRVDRSHLIGCIAVNGAVFFAPDEWVEQPADWSRQIVSGAGYDLGSGEGARVWQQCLQIAAARHHDDVIAALHDEQRNGLEQVVRPRLGQASFRLAVLDAYAGSCAVTGEHSLPVLEAAHIRPWAAGGRHELSNGLPLRRDLHRLFDLGFVTVRPDGRLAVSSRLREDYANGRTYYELEGRVVTAPARADWRPAPEVLEWHNDTVFLR